MYIADRANHRIRKVTPAGVISTVAGNGTAGYNGDDIAATSARLINPYSVTFDPAGNLYIADYDNERLRMVNTGGLITTIAGTGVATADGDGGDATEAGLHKPQYVQYTPAGDLIISESNNNDVRIVHEGIIDTLAGSRQFGFAGDGSFPIFSTWQRPSGTVLDQQGNLWIADRNNHRLRVIQAAAADAEPTVATARLCEQPRGTLRMFRRESARPATRSRRRLPPRGRSPCRGESRADRPVRAPRCIERWRRESPGRPRGGWRAPEPRWSGGSLECRSPGTCRQAQPRHRCPRPSACSGPTIGRNPRRRRGLAPAVAGLPRGSRPDRAARGSPPRMASAPGPSSSYAVKHA